jgi:flagellar biosynthesis protein FlhF
MDLRTYRARSLQEALRLVREDLGPDASVLHTRDVAGGISRWLGGVKEIEVTASAEVQVPSRLEALSRRGAADTVPAADAHDYRSKFRADLFQPQKSAGLEELCRQAPGQVHDDQATRLRKLEQEICVSGPIRVGGARPKIVAFVGPTGVGKTTSIAKLAAHYAIQQKCSVGLITVDTFRIAAVEQLRTYAEIMDLPLEVVSSPREMREAADRLSDCDVILLDTAGRSPRDEVRLAELRLLLAEAGASEIVLVLSATAGLESCRNAAAGFSRVGATSLLLTKMDEIVSLRTLVPVLCNPHLPLSYVTDGQNVPDDIRVAIPRELAERILGEACDPRPTRTGGVR